MQPRDATPTSQNSTSELAIFLRQGGPLGSNPGSRLQCGPSSESRPPRSMDDGRSIEKHTFGMSVLESGRTGSSGSSLTRSTSQEKLKGGAETSTTTFENYGLLYKGGVLVKQPAPTSDPRDPMNLSLSRKLLAIFFLCFFGALASAAELILGALLPVFFLHYAGLDPALLAPMSDDGGGLPSNVDPIKALASLPGAPPIWKVQLLASLPVLIMGLSNLGLVPLAISVGRRPVLLACGIVAILGAIWAGESHSLGSHIAARCVQGIGAGTVESLIPFIIQDMVFVHERNTWISIVFAAQGIIIIGLGIGTPYIVVDLSWRWVYFITASLAAFFLCGVFIFLPETKWHRSRAEMNGVPRRESIIAHAPRTWRSDMALFSAPPEWRKGWTSFLDTIYTFFYPQIFFITCLNSAMMAGTFAAGYNVAAPLLTNPWSWSFYKLGLALIPILIGAVFVAFLTGFVADWTANWAAKARGKRIPENRLLNLALPTICTIIGCVLFGLSGQHIGEYHWSVFLLGLGLIAFGFLGTNTVGAVYVLECYPHLAGPALVNIASFRCLIAFVLSFRVTEWVSEFGYLDSMLIYVGIISFFTLLIPVVYKFGPAWRKRWPATHRGNDGW
ncbi:Putative major facilitator superfamily, MFS transporter superfamily [Septoria linicola]|uniref:Major facilitator superfamily, MFS transporter superfamily n=1 Tax=Septoria linicola TaxID=215465 RepID=A0A9Q9EM06_9PEZI|nr:Putative major facilitator superfamily, MFS transporter superfamily [Septoria linicola]